MAKCAYCENETKLYEGGSPICIKCAETKRKLPAHEQELPRILLQEVLETTARAGTASDAFNAIMSDIPSGIPYPDSTLRIHEASRELSAARKEMMTAHSRLNDFLSRGIIPNDLKRAGGVRR
jgi:hypothetical protein